MRIHVVPYSKDWPLRYRAEEALIAEALGNDLMSVSHVGSTAVDGMPAVPVIDIVCTITDLSALETRSEALAQTGYERTDAPSPIGGALLRKHDAANPDTVVAQIMAVPERMGKEADSCLALRDYFARDKAGARAYVNFKRMMARQHGRDLDKYIASKAAFIRQMLRKAAR